jgi:hypothetical protein
VRRSLGVVVCGLVAWNAAGCSGPSPTDAGVRDATEEPVDTGEPSCLGPPGLYEPGSCSQLADGVLRYAPQYALWTDGAEKDRFIYLPPGARIDSTDPNEWVFPQGTRLYKTFSLSGHALETRLLEKTDDGIGLLYWSVRVFAWNEEGTEALEVGEDGQENVLGTDHDIPTHLMCERCHGGTGDIVNGFSALQLNHDGPGLTLAELNAMELLTTPISDSMARLPGDAATRGALGYLHANCGHCHREGHDAQITGLFLQGRIGLSDQSETAAWSTAVGVPGAWVAVGATMRIAPGDPDASTIIRRMENRERPIQMPPMGTERIDPDGLDVVRAWILGL